MDDHELRVPDVVKARRGWLGRVRRLLRRGEPQPLGMWISVTRAAGGPPVCNDIPADGKMHRLVWLNSASGEKEIYVDGERVR